MKNIKTCIHCGNPIIDSRPSHLAKRQFCSQTCHYASQGPVINKRISEQIGMPICEWLQKRYYEDLAIYAEICDELLINTRTLMRLMQECDIKPRNSSESVKVQWQRNPARREVQKTGPGTFKKGHTSWSTGLDKTKHPSLAKLSETRKGPNNPMFDHRNELHPNWQDGKDHWRRKDWLEIREIIKDRDGHICQQCGISETDHKARLGQPLCVHHIQPFSEVKEHNPDNLITLCHHCHISLHSLMQRQ